MYTSDPVDLFQIFANTLVFYSAFLPSHLGFHKKSLPSLKRSLGWHHPFTAVLALRMRPCMDFLLKKGRNPNRNSKFLWTATATHASSGIRFFQKDVFSINRPTMCQTGSDEPY